MSPEEMQALREDPTAVDELFRKLMNETMSRWIDMAEDRLAGTGIECIFAPGNDDPFFIDDLLSSSDVGGQPGRPGHRAARAATR